MTRLSLICILSILLGMTLPPLLANATPDVQEIVDRASAASYYQGRDGRAAVHMSIVDAQDRERTRDFVILRSDIDDVDNSEQRFYVHFDRPADVNRTAFLVWKNPDADDDRWLYLPALDLVKRIAPSDERTSFVGSHFFYEDVSGRGPREDIHTLEEETDVYYVVHSTPKEPGTTEFASYRNWIHKATFIPVKSEYYDETGEVYRIYTASSVEIVDGHPTVVQSSMVDMRIGGETKMSYSDVKYDLDLPDDIFTERYLRTPPRRLLR